MAFANVDRPTYSPQFADSEARYLWMIKNWIRENYQDQELLQLRGKVLIAYNTGRITAQECWYKLIGL